MSKKDAKISVFLLIGFGFMALTRFMLVGEGLLSGEAAVSIIRDLALGVSFLALVIAKGRVYLEQRASFNR